MLRSFAAVLFVLTVAGMGTTGTFVGAEHSPSRPSIASQEFDQTVFPINDRSPDIVTWVAEEIGRQRSDGEPVVVQQHSAAGFELGTSTMLSIEPMQPWLVGLGGLALVITGLAIGYRSGAIGIRTTNETDTAASTITEEELMTDEDRVLALLRNNDGRMKQVNIVNETGWSKSKVSMLLSDMDEEGLISKLRVGRENLISITGDEPEAARSPFEDDE
jgi:hypothetical protein